MFKSDLIAYFSNHHHISDTLPLYAQYTCFSIRLTDRVIVIELSLLQVSLVQVNAEPRTTTTMN